MMDGRLVVWNPRYRFEAEATHLKGRAVSIETEDMLDRGARTELVPAPSRSTPTRG